MRFRELTKFDIPSKSLESNDKAEMSQCCQRRICVSAGKALIVEKGFRIPLMNIDLRMEKCRRMARYLDMNMMANCANGKKVELGISHWGEGNHNSTV